MNLNYQMTFEDFMALQKDTLNRARHHQARSNVVFIALALMVLLLSLILFTILVPLFLGFFSENVRQLIIVCLSFVPVLLLKSTLVKYYDFVTLRQVRSLLKNDKRWPRNVTLHLHETGIQSNSTYNGIVKNTDIAWEEFKAVSEDDDRLFLYFENNEALILPKTYSSWTETEHMLLRDLIKQHLNHDFGQEKK